MGEGIKKSRDKIKILLVDDAPDFTHLMSQWFQARGLATIVAANGEEALAMIQEYHPDIVFLDTIMPVMDGYAVLKQIREFDQSLPVIMMSVYKEDGRIKKALELPGMFGFFDKKEGFSKALTLIKDALKIEGEAQDGA